MIHDDSRTRSGMSRGSKIAPGALEWLAADPQAATLLGTADRLIAAQSVVQAALPVGTAPFFRATRIDRQQLTLSVPSAAHAARLRQLGPRLAQHLRTQGWAIEGIVVRIDAGLGALGAKPPLREARGLSPQAVSAFDDLHRGLRPGPLAEAVGQLLSRYRP